MRYLVLIFIICFSSFTHAQVGINTTTPNAQLDIRSSNQAAPSAVDGMLIPKIDNFPAINPDLAQQGMLVYLTTNIGSNQPGFYYWNNPTLTWIPIGNNNNSGWNVTGNTGTNPTTNFIGTTDNQDLVFKRNNNLAGVINTTNSAFGLNTLLSNTAVNNSAFGLNTLRNNTTGFSNAAFGDNTMLTNITGTNNAAFGSSALRFNNDGINNAAFGMTALLNNTSGSNNSALGFSSLRNNTIGFSNAAFGDNSMLLNLSGDNNVALGSSALRNNSSGVNNTANGSSALINNTIGNLNSAFGFTANVAFNNLTNATAIGANALVASNNSLVLGSISGVNSATATVNVGIGTTTPLDRLHVVGNIRMVDGNQAIGRVLTSDINGRATWQNASANAWGLSGNIGTDPSINFIGTTDDHDVVFRRNNIRSGRLSATNTAFGRLSLNSTTSGTNNSAYGVSAVSDNTTGSFNTGNGYNALLKNDTGNSNTAVGYNSLPSNTFGSFNTAIGGFALSGNEEGDFNTGLGYRTNFFGTLTNSTAIGARALVSSNNSMVLGSIIGINGATSSVNVGIGTTSPQARLHVVGNIRMVDGNQALGRVLTSSANGTASWQNASANAWGLTGNVGTDPSINFIGTTDNQDVVFRRNNVESGRIGEFNSSYGLRALALNTLGVQNTANGINSLRANTSGVNNTANGYASLFFNTTGGSNTAIGANTLFSNNIGGFNTANGVGVLFSNFSGSHNTGIGVDALSTNSSGTFNTAVGVSSLFGNGTGSFNTALGTLTNVLMENLTNATAIGARARVDASNSMVLGSINGINGATASVNVGIGTTTPQQKLHISGPAGLTAVRIANTSGIGANSNVALDFFRNTAANTDWRIYNIGANLTIGNSGDDLATVNDLYQYQGVRFMPMNDATQNLGLATSRWNTLFASNGTINTSDAREKKNIQNLTYGLTTLMQLRPVSFEWNKDDGSGTKLGLIAQELQQLIPEVVRDWDWEEDEQGNRKKVSSPILGVYYSDLIPVLIKATQEQQLVIEQQKGEIDLLKQQLEGINKFLMNEIQEFKLKLNKL